MSDMSDFQKATWYAYSTSESTERDDYPESGGFVMTPVGPGYAPPKRVSSLTSGTVSEHVPSSPYSVNCPTASYGSNTGAANVRPTARSQHHEGVSIGDWLFVFGLIGFVCLWFVAKLMIAIICAVFML
jgi:hypothetical protein